MHFCTHQFSVIFLRAANILIIVILAFYGRICCRIGSRNITGFVPHDSRISFGCRGIWREVSLHPLGGWRSAASVDGAGVYRPQGGLVGFDKNHLRSFDFHHTCHIGLQSEKFFFLCVISCGIKKSCNFCFILYWCGETLIELTFHLLCLESKNSIILRYTKIYDCKQLYKSLFMSFGGAINPSPHSVLYKGRLTKILILK